jgi:nucleoside 2-deoxyribosyltransferase
MKVYLAGPIAGQSDTSTFQWREIMSIMLKQVGIDSIDPAKLRDFRNVEYPGDVAVVEPDKADIDSCDVLLANAHIVSVGTSMEVIYAWERGKFVIVRHPTPATASPWLHYHSHVFTASLGGALQAIEEYKAMTFVERTARLRQKTDQ